MVKMEVDCNLSTGPILFSSSSFVCYKNNLNPIVVCSPSWLLHSSCFEEHYKKRCLVFMSAQFGPKIRNSPRCARLKINCLSNAFFFAWLELKRWKLCVTEEIKSFVKGFQKSFTCLSTIITGSKVSTYLKPESFTLRPSLQMLLKPLLGSSRRTVGAPVQLRELNMY